MILYDEKGEKINFKVQDRLGVGLDGNVYRTSETECLKVYKNSASVDKEILEFIKKLCLRNYYEILDFYYNKSGTFKAHLMTYYQDEDIDILTMPTEYTLDNLFRIQNSVRTLTQNNIQIEDTHTGNIIMDSSNITITDVDLYVFNRFYTKGQLEKKNIEKLEYLFREIFTESISDYHREYQSYRTSELIRNTFKLYTPDQVEETFTRLSKYKYPIDYIKKKIKLR